MMRAVLFFATAAGAMMGAGAAHAQTGTRNAGIGAIGAGSFPACPGG